MTKPQVEMPLVTFLFTIEQVAAMIGVSEHDMHYKYCYFLQRSTGRKGKHQVVARNIAPDDEDPQWRISHQDWVRWLSANGFEVTHPYSL